MIKILVSLPHKQDSCSFYRAYGVFADLNKKFNGQLQFIDLKQGAFTWADFNNIDLLFLQRPYAADLVPLVDYFRDMNKPIWVDYDDNLFEIPACNPAHHAFTDKAKSIMTYIMHAAQGAVDCGNWCWIQLGRSPLNQKRRPR